MWIIHTSSPRMPISPMTCAEMAHTFTKNNNKNPLKIFLNENDQKKIEWSEWYVYFEFYFTFVPSKCACLFKEDRWTTFFFEKNYIRKERAYKERLVIHNTYNLARVVYIRSFKRIRSSHIQCHRVNVCYKFLSYGKKAIIYYGEMNRCCRCCALCTRICRFGLFACYCSLRCRCCCC